MLPTEVVARTVYASKRTSGNVPIGLALWVEHCIQIPLGLGHALSSITQELGGTSLWTQALPRTEPHRISWLTTPPMHACVWAQYQLRAPLL
jgi:hypothetical protein